MCAEKVGANVYTFAYRGFEGKIAAGLDTGLENSPCIFCGNCISVCPTGALQPKLIRGQGRVFDVDKVQTVCPYCGVGCAISLQTNQGKIIGAVGANGPANNNLLCVKGRFGWDFIQHPDRLKQPLIRKGGELVPASWDEARLCGSKALGSEDQIRSRGLGGLSSESAPMKKTTCFEVHPVGPGDKQRGSLRPPLPRRRLRG